MTDKSTDQLRFGKNGELERVDEEERTSDAVKDNGEPMGRFESKAGYNIFDVNSLLQKGCRRSDESVVAWAAWELCRSGYTKMYWRRIITIAVEDIAISDSVTTTVLNLHRLATGQIGIVDGWESSESRGRICAIRAAVCCAQATSGRLTEFMNDTFNRVAEERVEAAKEGRGPQYDFPAGDLESKGTYDVVFDMHTARGSARGRGYGHFLVHSSRTDHISGIETEFKRMNMELVDAGDDTPASFSDTEYDHALSPVSSESPWDEPDLMQETLDTE